MANVNFVSLAGTKRQAGLMKTDLANSILHLFKSPFLPSPATTLAELDAQECDFDGYAAKTITAWGDPVLAPISGYMIVAPTQTWVMGAGPIAVGNTVGGHYLEDSAGNLIDVVIYDPPIPMQSPDQSVIQTPVEVYPTGP